MADTNEKKTLVDEGTEFHGTMSSKCPVVVRGAIDGELNAPSLRVTESGSVSGKVKVGELTSEGSLSGEFDADTVRLSGVVKDATVIRARTLEVSLGAPDAEKMKVVFGEATLEVGEIAQGETAAPGAAGGRGGRRRE